MLSGSSVFQWEELIDLAERLSTNSAIGTEEAICRTIIGRSYYGAFCLARNLASQNGWVRLFDDGRDHGKVKAYYKHNENKAKKQIGLNLERLHADRKYADYEDRCFGSKEKATKSIYRAQDIRHQLRRFMPPC
ncbi:MAG: hypothetical protein ACOX2B_05375 [Syntrophothermaceae bacterium]|jgi:uncharacterized protein (UPF0332 family)